MIMNTLILFILISCSDCEKSAKRYLEETFTDQNDYRTPDKDLNFTPRDLLRRVKEKINGEFKRYEV